VRCNAYIITIGQTSALIALKSRAKIDGNLFANDLGAVEVWFSGVGV